MKVRVDLVCYLAQNAQFTNTTAEFIIGDLVDKVGDVKNGSGCQEALSCIAEATSLEYVSSQVRDNHIHLTYTPLTRPWYEKNCLRERSGSVVECLTRDRRATGSSLTGVTVLCFLSKTHLS